MIHRSAPISCSWSASSPSIRGRSPVRVSSNPRPGRWTGRGLRGPASSRRRSQWPSQNPSSPAARCRPRSSGRRACIREMWFVGAATLIRYGGGAGTLWPPMAPIRKDRSHHRIRWNSPEGQQLPSKYGENPTLEARSLPSRMARQTARNVAGRGSGRPHRKIVVTCPASCRGRGMSSRSGGGVSQKRNPR